MAMRAQSHGCVRVQDIELLVTELLEDDGSLDADSVRDVLTERKSVTYPLKTPIMIHFEYAVTVVDDSGIVRFLPNPYRM
jgi:murein L,D-transpeptidase YcbB/YkuD